MLFLCSAHVFLEYIIHTLTTLHRQHQAIKISSGTLNLHVLVITDQRPWQAGHAATLLAGVDADLIGQVEIQRQVAEA